MNATAPVIDIQPDQRAIVCDILARHVPHHTVWAFGSRTTGGARPYSDLDLVVLTHTPLPLSTRAAVRESFSESDLPWKVDVLDWTDVSDEFRHIIEQDKVVIQQGEAGAHAG